MKLLPCGNYFDKALVLTLPRREDRLEAFLADLPTTSTPLYNPFEVFMGCDGSRMGDAPAFCGETPGCWGCRQSHLRILEKAFSNGWQRLLVLEDDARTDMLAENFDQIVSFLDKVPDDFDYLQLGYAAKRRRERLDQDDTSRSAVCTTPRGVRTHAVIYNGSSASQIYRMIWDLDASHVARGEPIRHIDQSLNLLSTSEKITRYVPPNSLIGYRKEASSDVKPYRKDPRNRL